MYLIGKKSLFLAINKNKIFSIWWDEISTKQYKNAKLKGPSNRVFSACWEAIFGAPQLCLHLELPIQNVVQIFGATCENWGVAGDKICLLHRVAVFLSDIWT
ncbi:hypothetical protein M9H77_04329 [Catharanthus roseus]|uniref:Uncharacterized protein n=1 Tax=Catharanthus roseus TaxID=4058 RepID=A0ACC0CDV6_CATRO|nr:hypothetical protein M9H77_04329 [Catharanthus roseus]